MTPQDMWKSELDALGIAVVDKVPPNYLFTIPCTTLQELKQFIDTNCTPTSNCQCSFIAKINERGASITVNLYRKIR